MIGLLYKSLLRLPIYTGDIMEMEGLDRRQTGSCGYCGGTFNTQIRINTDFDI
jgi:hypothetical protein